MSEEPVTWRQYLEPYAEMCGRGLRSIPRWLAECLAGVGSLPGVSLPLDRERLAVATGRFVSPADKARKELGWSPRVGLAEGMERTTAWLREEGLA